MSVQHRKNKSVLINQIRINPVLQAGSHSGNLRASQDGVKKGQYFDNYQDFSSTQHHLSSGSAALTHNLSQSTHRKNKTTVIGSGKLAGANSSSAFQPSVLHPSLIATDSHAPMMKKVQGGTISHSHKSLRSSSSRRGTSMDSGQKGAYSKACSGHLTPDLSSYANASA